MKILAVVDTPSIQKYVFETPHLVEIEGASARLDRLNRIELPQLLQAETIYANGGSGQFVFHDHSLSEAEEVLRQAEGMYAQATKGGAALLWAAVPFEDDYKSAVQKAYTQLRSKRDLASRALRSGALPLTKLCESCNSRPASSLFNRPDDIFLCDICLEKRKSAYEKRSSGIWTELEAYLDTSVDRPKKFPEIGDQIGIVYADGNAMGRLIKQIDTADDYRLFSETVDQAVRESCFKALARLLQNTQNRPFIPASILLLGGDDLVVVLPAEEALQFAYEVGKTYETITEQRLKPLLQRIGGAPKLTLSFGVAVARVNHPFAFLLDAAQQLLASAKVRGSEINSETPPSCIDFHLANSTSAINIARIRSQYAPHDSDPSYKHTRRPYTFDDLEVLTEVAYILRSEGYPTSQLNAMYQTLFANPTQTAFQAMEVWVQGRPGPRKSLRKALERANCFDPLPWSKQRDTVLSELVEFYDLIPKQILGRDHIAQAAD